MTRLPQITPRQMLSALGAQVVVRGAKGSHHYLVHKDYPTRRTTVAMHPGDFSVRDTRDILEQSKLSRGEFLKLL